MMHVCNEANEMMMREWVKRSHEENSIKDMRDLYSLWLECCQNAYQQSLRNKTYEDAYNKFMENIAKFWKTAVPMR